MTVRHAQSGKILVSADFSVKNYFFGKGIFFSFFFSFFLILFCFILLLLFFAFFFINNTYIRNCIS